MSRSRLDLWAGLVSRIAAFGAGAIIATFVLTWAAIAALHAVIYLFGFVLGGFSFLHARVFWANHGPDIRYPEDVFILALPIAGLLLIFVFPAAIYLAMRRSKSVNDLNHAAND